VVLVQIKGIFADNDHRWHRGEIVIKHYHRSKPLIFSSIK
jgi:hypothetical protein